MRCCFKRLRLRRHYSAYLKVDLVVEAVSEAETLQTTYLAQECCFKRLRLRRHFIFNIITTSASRIISEAETLQATYPFPRDILKSMQSIATNKSNLLQTENICQHLLDTTTYTTRHLLS